MPGTAYYDRSVAVTNSASIPPNIRCNRCKKVKNPDCFSKKKLNDLLVEMRRPDKFHPAVKAVIGCIGCTGGQVVELHCYVCDKTKPLEAFAKAQRRTPDSAVCWMCAEERANYEPGEVESDMEPALNEDDSDASDNSDDLGINVITSGTENMSVNTSNWTSDSPAGGVALNGSTETRTTSLGWTTNSSSKTAGTPTTATSTTMKSPIPGRIGFDPNAYRKGSPSVAGSVSTTRQQQQQGGGRGAGARGFAKVKPKRQQIVYDYAEQERQRKYQDEDSDVAAEGSDDE